MRITPPRRTGGCRSADAAEPIPMARRGCATRPMNESYPVQGVGWLQRSKTGASSAYGSCIGVECNPAPGASVTPVDDKRGRVLGDTVRRHTSSPTRRFRTVTRRRGDQALATVARSRSARLYGSFLAQRRPHPHPDRRPLVPRFFREPRLSIDRRGHCVTSPGERHPEPIPTRREHIPSVRLDRRPEDQVVTLQCFTHRLRRRLPQTASTPQCP